jgi:hypothetical protein
MVRRMQGRFALIAAAVVAVAVGAVAASTAVATTLPETTYFYNVTMTDSKLVVKPHASVKPGSLVVFTVRNQSTQTRNLVFGNYKTGYIHPGKKKQFELNFLVPWSFVGFSVERGGGHRITARFICTW